MSKKDALLAGRNLITGNIRQCWAPEIVKAVNECQSHYFGSPWLSDDEAWPCILGQPALFVLQLDLAKFPPAIQGLVGNAGLLQFFYQTDDRVDVDWSNGVDQLARVRIVQPDNQIGGPRKPPVTHGYPKKKPKFIGGWNERQDYPHSEEYADIGIAGNLAEIAYASGLYEDDFSGKKYFSLQGDKLGGWPFWSQAVEYPMDSNGDLMAMLYQIDAGCFFDGPHLKAHAKNLFAGDGTGHIFVSKNNPSELIFKWATS